MESIVIVPIRSISNSTTHFSVAKGDSIHIEGTRRPIFSETTKPFVQQSTGWRRHISVYDHLSEPNQR